MQQYVDFDFGAFLAGKQLEGTFMSKETLAKYSANLFNKMQAEVRLMLEVSCSITTYLQLISG